MKDFFRFPETSVCSFSLICAMMAMEKTSLQADGWRLQYHPFIQQTFAFAFQRFRRFLPGFHGAFKVHSAFSLWEV